MSDDPVELDAHRGMAAQQSTEMRRRLHQVHADHEALRVQRAELEGLMLAAPAATWPEAAEKARYLIQLFGTTPEAVDPRRQALIASVLADFARLSG